MSHLLEKSLSFIGVWDNILSQSTFWGRSQDFEETNVEQSILQDFKIENIEETKDELWRSFYFSINRSVNTENINPNYMKSLDFQNNNREQRITYNYCIF